MSYKLPFLKCLRCRDADKLTEVVGHQGGGGGGRLGELFSPAALLLQVLQNGTNDPIISSHFKPLLCFDDKKPPKVLTSVLTSRTDLKSLDIEANLDCRKQRS